jgi:hypothetical protein
MQTHDEDRCRRDQPIYAIHHPAMPWKHLTTIFHTNSPFDHAFKEIANY